MAGDVALFVGAIAHELGALSGRADAEHTADATNEAGNLVTAIIAADGRLTDSELDAYLDCIGPILDPPLITTAAHVRETDLFSNRDEWLAEPSELFDLLVRADAKQGTRRSHRYYDVAMRLAHVTAATDLVPSLSELEAIDGYRTRLLQAMDAAGINRPGQPQPAPGSSSSGGCSCETADRAR